MPIFAEILHVFSILKSNEKLIEKALQKNIINKGQFYYLIHNNNKWYQTCNHKGLLYIEDGKYYFITRTSVDYPLVLPKELKHEPYNKLITKAEVIRFNDNCQIVNKKWVLGDTDNNQIKYNDLEGRPDIIANLVGSAKDLNELKSWVQTLDLQKYDISDFFDIHRVIHEFEIINLSKNIIKDE